MTLYPKATKSRMVKLLRAKGAVIPSLYQAEFSKLKYSFWLRWKDKENHVHTACYSGSAGRPILQIDKEWVPITMAEVIRFDLVEEK